MTRIARRFRFSFGTPAAGPTPDDPAEPEAPTLVDFRAYSADCIVSGRTILAGDRLSDMLNDQDEFSLLGVSVELLDDGDPMTIDEVVVAREEIWLVDTGEPRGVEARRHRTAQQYIALKMGPYRVRGFFHGLPGTDPITSIGRRKQMIPLTTVRIEYTIAGQAREARTDVAIVNRAHVEWLDAIEPDRADFPPKPAPRTTEEPTDTPGQAPEAPEQAPEATTEETPDQG